MIQTETFGFIAFSREVSRLLTCGEFGEVLLLLGFVSEKQNSLEADGLVRPQSDADAQILAANDLHQPSVLETRPARSMKQFRMKLRSQQLQFVKRVRDSKQT